MKSGPNKKAAARGGGSRFTPKNQIRPAANAGTYSNVKVRVFHDIRPNS